MEVADRALLLPNRQKDASTRSRRWRLGVITMVASMGLMLCTRKPRMQTAQLAGIKRLFSFRRGTQPSSPDVGGRLNGAPAFIAKNEAPYRKPYTGGLVRASCVNNDDDMRYSHSCPRFDQEAWCSHEKRTGPGTKFNEICADACVDPKRAFAMVCAWQAVANLRSVCAGTFKPTPPVDSANRPNQLWAPSTGGMESGEQLYGCDDHAVCYACFGDSFPSEQDGEMCERVAAHYGGFGLVDDQEIETGAEAAFSALEDIDEWCAMLDPENESAERGEYGFAPAWARPPESGLGGEYVQHWGTPGAERIQEHIVRDSRHIKERFMKDVYAYWRYVLVGKSGALDAEVHVHTTETSLKLALAEHRVAPGALVFVDLTYGLIDQQHFPGNDTSLSALGNRAHYAKSLGMCSFAKLCHSKLNKECVYQHTTNLILRSATLRALLAYERPLTIFLAGDLSCRLSGQLPLTHHQIIIANDGAQAMVDEYNARLEASAVLAPRAVFFPFGMEGVPVLSDPAASALDAASSGTGFRIDAFRQPYLPASRRTYFISVSASINRRKPSRLRLYEWLVNEGGFDRIEDLRQREAAALVNSVQFTDDRPFRFGAEVDLGAPPLQDVVQMTRRSVFSVAPAGDYWTT